MFTREEMQGYRCPRYHEWPGLDLYMDQVISLLEHHVSVFYGDPEVRPVTATMINNYVKQKIITRSKNKKYQRDHLAYLYVVFLLKPVLNLTDICNGIAFLESRHSTEEAYNLFCDAIEEALAITFGGKIKKSAGETEGIEIIQSISMAFAYTLLARYYIAQDKPVP